MTTATLSLARPATVAVPRGAVLVGWLADLGIALYRRQQQARALRHSERTNERRAREAAALHRWAQQLQDREPSFAADVRAAADRHTGA